MKYILDDKDNVIPCEDVIKWGKWFEDNRSRRILCRTYLTPEVYVSTVFLAMDHGSLHPDDKPILWETAVMGLKGAEEFEGYGRYETREEAIKGHWETIEEVRKYLEEECHQENLDMSERLWCELRALTTPVGMMLTDNGIRGQWIKVSYKVLSHPDNQHCSFREMEFRRCEKHEEPKE